MRELEDPTIVRESWLTKQAISSSDYRALLAFLRYTPWGENWAGEQTYSRAPGLSLAELDRAWQLERWRFANKRDKYWYGLPNLGGLRIMGIGALLALLGTVRALVNLGPIALLMPGVVLLAFVAGMVALWKQYQPYHQAKRAYEKRRATLLAATEQGWR